MVWITLDTRDKDAIISSGLMDEWRASVIVSLVGNAILSLYGGRYMSAELTGETAKFITRKLDELYPGMERPINRYLDSLYLWTEGNDALPDTKQVRPADFVGGWILRQLCMNPLASDQIKAFDRRSDLITGIGTTIQLMTLRWWDAGWDSSPQPGSHEGADA